MKITARNDFHLSRCILYIRGNHLDAARVAKLRRRLCAKDCGCFTTYTRFFNASTGERIYHRNYGVDGWILDLDTEGDN